MAPHSSHASSWLLLSVVICVSGTVGIVHINALEVGGVDFDRLGVVSTTTVPLAPM
jgi:hypothetical protein